MFLIFFLKHNLVPIVGELGLHSFLRPLYVLVEELAGSLLVPKVCYSIPIFVVQIFLSLFLKHILVATIGKFEM